MSILSQSQGYVVLLLFGLAMLFITYFFARWRKWKTKEGFLVAERKVKWWLGGPSIAASWIWAGALFVSVQMTYQKGYVGLFWFTLPNIIALGIFGFLGPRIRKRFPNGYTLPQYIRHRFKNENLHSLYLVPFFIGQVIAVTFNIFAGASVVMLLTGIPLVYVMPILALIALTYTLISGLEASIVTDIVQMILILFGIGFIVPLAVKASGGFAFVTGGLYGIESIKSVFNPAVAFSFGVVTSIGLISQTITDQQYWQRVFAMKKGHIVKAFIFGALLFAVVPISLSMLGFIGANPDLGVVVADSIDPSMIGILVIDHLLPSWVVVVFVVILLGGLSSTIDSGIAATSSLWVTDVRKNSKNIIRHSRFAMVGVVLLGLIIAYIAHFVAGFGVGQLFLLSISVAASASVPTVLSLYRNKMTAQGMFYGILFAISIGMPIFVYANMIGSEKLTAVASILMLTISTGLCFKK